MAGLTSHLENLQKIADIRKTQTETAHEKIKAAHTQAQIGHTHADTHATHIGAAVDALTPIPAPESGNGDGGGEGQSTGTTVARRAADGNSYIPDQSRPGKFAMVKQFQVPPGARKAKDGNWYLPDQDRPGKFKVIVPRAA
jgi:hypothetical protein